MMKSNKMMWSVWIVLFTLGFSLLMGRSVATAESEFPVEDPNSSEPTAFSNGISTNEEAYTLSLEQTQIRETLSLEASNYFIIPPAGFNHIGSNDSYEITNGYITGNAYMVAPIYLPLGASIDGIEVRVHDYNDSLSEMFILCRINLETGALEQISTVSSPEGSTGGLVSLVSETVTSPIVSEEYAYQLWTLLRENILVYGVRIGYSYSSYIPSVQN